MQTTRRGFIGAVGSAIAAATATVQAGAVTIVRPSTETDLAWSSLLDAMGRVGEGPYTLRVHPSARGYARAVLCRNFPRADWRRDFTIATHDEHDMDAWSLSNGRVMFYTNGA